MGLSLKKLGKGLVDIFSADTEEDQRKRQAAGQAQFYADQQRAQGNMRPTTNVGSAFLGNTAKLANTARAGAGGIYGLGKIAKSSLFDTDQQYNQEVSGVQKTLNEDLNPNGGVFSSGTFFDTPEQARTISAAEIAKKSLAGGVGVYGEVGPGVKGLSVAEQGWRAAPKLAAEGAAVGAGSNIGDQYIRTGKVDPKQALVAAAAGGVTEVLPSAIFAGAKGALNEGSKTVGGKALYKAKDLTSYEGAPDKARVKMYENQIKKNGTTKPLVLLKDSAGNLGIEDGKHRFQAYKNLGIDDIPAIDKTPGKLAGNQIGAVGANVLEKPKVSLREAPKVSKLNLDDPFENTKPLQRLRNEAGKLFVDEDAEMINFLKRAEKDTGKTGLVDQWLYNTNTQRAAPSIANAKMRQSPEFKETFAGLSKREAKDFDTFLAARAELKNYDGLPTSKTKAELENIVASRPEFEQRFANLNADNKKWTQDLADSGIIDQDTAKRWLADDDYIRVQRDMEDLLGVKGQGTNSRSFGSTTTKQKRTGSDRDILSPSRTAVSRRQQLQLEIQKNRTAKETIDVLSELGVANQVPDGTRKNVIKRFVDGKVQYWEVPADIKRVVDNVSPYQLGVIAKIVSTPARVFRAGTTALSAPFTVTNYLRDQASSGLYSESVLNTHNPANIARGLKEAAIDFGTTGNKNSELWDKFTTFAGDQTIYDDLRNAKSTDRFLREARQGGKGKLLNTVTAPITSLEELNSITEKATRFQNFKGMYDKTLRETGSEEAATRAGVKASRENSVDFQRSGQVTRVLNMLIPYFNAGIQGSRNVARSFRDRPVGTTAKSVGFLAAPTMAITAANMSGLLNPDSREIYESIPDFEKQDNFIVILPGAKQRDDGRWEGILKIPKPQGYRELTDPSREITEAFMGGEPAPNALVLAKDMLSGLTGPINIEDKNKFAAGFLPAAAKPTVQQQANKDFYSGGKIVPDFMVEGTDDPTKRAYSRTSGTARKVAGLLNTEPVRVEKFIEDSFGSLGRYGLNASDNALAKAGAIPKDQIGGRSMKSDFSRRLFESGGDLLDKNKSAGQKFYESRTKALKAVGLNKNEQAAYDSLHPDKTNFLGEDIFDENKRVARYTKAGTYLQFPKTFEVDKQVDADQRAKGKPGNPIFDLKGTELNKVLLKQALPPGAKDPELDKLYEQPWYQDYQNANTKYYSAVEQSLKAEGKSMPKSDNPRPMPSTQLQTAMDSYSSLPKGTGARSAWIKANPKAWADMTNQWAATDAWENKEREKLGLSAIVDDGTGTGGSSFSKSGSGGGKSVSPGSDYKYAVSLNAGGEVAKPKVSIKKAAAKKAAKAKSSSLPKVSVKKSKV